MSDYIPFEIQSNILRNLPVKSLVQFRSVSKEWKCFIDKFIKTYHINHPNPKHHLLAEYDDVPKYTSIVDDNTFPPQKFPLTAPEPLKLLRHRRMLGSVDGLLCFYGEYKDVDLEAEMVVLWNPSVGKCVPIVIPNVVDLWLGYTRIGFGVCSNTSDPKLIKINVVETPRRSWEVQVFTLSSRVWRTVYTRVPFKSKSTRLMCGPVVIDGIIYWLTRAPFTFIVSFDLKSEKFGKVWLPNRKSIRIEDLSVVKVKESLGLLEYYKPSKESEMWLCGVWMRTEGVNQPFEKIYTVKVQGDPVFNRVFNRVLEFTNNGKDVIQVDDDDDDDDDFKYKSHLEVYDPSPGRANCLIGISGRRRTFSVWSYMETILLLDQSNSIIH